MNNAKDIASQKEEKLRDCHVRVSARALIVEEGCVLLVEFDDETGLHYNLPGGGTRPGESVIEALKREAREEAEEPIRPEKTERYLS